MPEFSIRGMMLIACCLIGFSACSKAPQRPPMSIAGVVKLDGEPLSAGSVQFTSLATGESAYVNVSPEGKYEIRFPEGDIGLEYGISVGPPVDSEVDATQVAENPPPKVKQTIPGHYSNRMKSGLSTVIKNAGENKYDIELTSK